MGAQVYELWGHDPRGGRAMGHLIALGAHDGHGRMGPNVKRARPNANNQYRSWFSTEAGYVHDDSPVIAQIFFPSGDSNLDSVTDGAVTQAVIAEIRYLVGMNIAVKLEFVGHADPSGPAAFNKALALKRAQHVARRVERGVRQDAAGGLLYSAKVTSLGESDPTGDYKADRRVDVVLRVGAPNRVKFDPIVVPGDYTGPLTNTLQFKGYGGVSVSLFKIVGADSVEVEVRNPKTGRSAFYSYTGANVGTPSPIPIGGSPPDSSYTDKDIPIGAGYVDIEDFEGPGSIVGAALGQGGSNLVFAGPKLQMRTKDGRSRGIEVFMTGWAIQFPGASAGGGYWRRMPYSTEAGRDRYKAERNEELRDRMDRHR